MKNMGLMATSLGISFHVVSSLATDSVAEEVIHLLDIPEDMKIVFAIHLDYPTAQLGKYLRVRCDLEDFTHYNSFNNRGQH
jgi:nitroreductase